MATVTYATSDGSSRSSMDTALKDIYLPRLRSVVRKKRVLSARLKSNAEQTSVSGRQAVVPINLRPSEAVGARGDGELLPAPQKQIFDDSIVPYRYNYGTIRITHPTIAATRNDAGAWVKVANSEMKGIERDLENDFNRQNFGYGSGVLGRASNAGSTSSALTLDPGHKVKPNMLLDSFTALGSGTKELDAAVVSSVSGNAITLSATDDWTDNAFVFRTGVTDANPATPTYHERMGLQGIIDDSTLASGIGTFVETLQGITRDTYTEWNANVFEGATAGTGRQISETILDDSIFTVEENGEGSIDFGITTRIQFRKIGHLKSGDMRYSPSTTIEGGFRAIKWAEIPIFYDKDCPVDVNNNDMLFWVDEDYIEFYELSDFDWDAEDGNILHRNQGYATYDATLFKYGNMGSQDPAKHGCVRDLLRT